MRGRVRARVGVCVGVWSGDVDSGLPLYHWGGRSTESQTTHSQRILSLLGSARLTHQQVMQRLFSLCSTQCWGYLMHLFMLYCFTVSGCIVVVLFKGTGETFILA